MTAMTLSDDYRGAYEQLLAAVAARPGVEPPKLVGFWPMVGHAYTGELLVIGRAVNGWIDHEDVAALVDPAVRAGFANAARQTAEGSGDCPMAWVTERWSPGDGQYSTARSAFWRHIRAVLAAVDPASGDDPSWSSRLAWTNLAKLAPADGGNPGGPLLDVQREIGPGLIRREVLELAPRRVLVLTGRWWFEPFAEGIGLEVDWRDDLVAGVARDSTTSWVIAGHPQGKPRHMLDEVVEAFERSS